MWFSHPLLPRGHQQRLATSLVLSSGGMCVGGGRCVELRDAARQMSWTGPRMAPQSPTQMLAVQSGVGTQVTLGSKDMGRGHTRAGLLASDAHVGWSLFFFAD